MIVLALSCAGIFVSAADDGGNEFFESRIRPLLAANCFKCHSAEAPKIKAGLRVDSREFLLKGGDNGPALVPGHPEQSRMIEAVGYANVDLQMPPKMKLADPQIADLTEWIKKGAPWPGQGAAAPATAAIPAFDLQKRRASHWAWQPVRPQNPPAVKNEAWPRGAIDRFVLAKLEENKMEPAPQADRRALARRLYFDLTGLPPSTQEVEAFVGDPSPDAYPKLIDSLLASPHFGERWARHWLDLVRYGDSLGHEFDFANPNAYRYRDYCIRALNTDLPYNQFVTEQFAGDLVEHPRTNPADGSNESIIGTGFFWLGEAVHSPVDIRQNQADRFDNIIDVTGKTFLGLTIACARCHDHKFDAISTADYYALYGYLDSSRFTQAAVDSQKQAAQAAELSSLKGQIREAAVSAWKNQAQQISHYMLAAGELTRTTPPPALDEIARKFSVEPKRLEQWSAALREKPASEIHHPLYAWSKMAAPGPQPEAKRWTEIAAHLTAGSDAAAQSSQRASDVEIGDFSKPAFGAWFAEDHAFGSAPVQPAEIIVGDEAHPLSVVHSPSAHSGALSRRLEGTLRSPSFTIDRRYVHVLASGAETRINLVMENFALIRSPIYGGLRKEVNHPEPVWITFDLDMWKGRRAYLEMVDTVFEDMGEGRRYKPDGYISIERAILSDDRPPSRGVVPAGLALLGAAACDSAGNLAERYQIAALAGLADIAMGKPADAAAASSRAAWVAWLVEHKLLDAPKRGPEEENLAALLSRYRKIEESIVPAQRVLATIEGTPEDEKVFIRGSPKNLGTVAQRHLLEALGSPGKPEKGSGRMELAKAIADPGNPLTARVMVNRIWHHLFGRGIVASTDNFGIMGEKPTHPELLDDLADRFVKEGWSLKKTIREMLLSAAYQMSSHASADADRLDPENKLLHRANVRRLEGEVIRDEVLALSGRLDLKMFGPPVEVYLTPFMEGRGRPGNSGPLDGDGRRSVYLNVRRNFLTPMLLAFDMPAPFSSMGRRNISNVPAQALILLNDPFIVQQARVWAKRELSDTKLTPQEHIQRMYNAAFARPPSDAESAATLAFIEEQGNALGLDKSQAAADERVWSDLAHVLINAKEFIFLN